MPVVNGFTEHRSSSKRGESRSLTGTAGADVFYGAYGDDIFVGNGGQDLFYGGYGNDKIDFRWAGSKIKIDLGNDQYQNTGGGGSVSVHNIHGLFATPYADYVWGSNGNDWLSGEGGNDQLFGGYGWDTLLGGAGDDQLDGGTGKDSLSGDAGNDILTGGADDDTLDGGVGDDQLDGGSGADNLDGGYGNDKLIGGPGIDQINGGDGWDIASFITATSAVTIDRHDVSGKSNGGDAQYEIYKNIEAYELSNYSDKFIAYGETVTVYGAGGNDTITGSGGRDQLFGDDGIDTLNGGAENDVLHGGAGNDTLYGDSGTDSLFGESGADTFAFGPGDSTNAHPDTIMDFSHAEKDKIDLSKIDAVAGGGDNAFHFIGLSAFSGAAGELSMAHLDATTWKIMGDTNGDRIADFTILVVTSVQPVIGDFTL